MVNTFLCKVLLSFLVVTASCSVLADSLSQPGIKVGMSYEKGKNMMLNNGWSITDDKDKHTRHPYHAYPEISCGSGRYAICSAGFNKGESFIALTVESRNGTLVVSGEY